MTTASGDTRLGRLEGRLDELSVFVQDLRQDLRAGLQEVNRRIDQMNSRVDQLNTRIDRLFLAMLGIGAAQIALLITLVVRGG